MLHPLVIARRSENKNTGLFESYLPLPRLQDRQRWSYEHPPGDRMKFDVLAARRAKAPHAAGRARRPESEGQSPRIQHIGPVVGNWRRFRRDEKFALSPVRESVVGEMDSVFR